ncbi:hypothetical protein Q8A67_000019 [Cirrhinus molitorella]|uniref:THAP-type domain-containing protein n=1 Tax=Cirrhinus molitorella TaxID=172907 RepID=A0AA88QE11_9TELE|nr:hypothetical protein Q8A67_000019 [Cirrhinus molitorella]
MKRQSWTPNKSSHLCSEHFESHHFTTDSRVLETWAQPQRRASFVEPEYLRTGACDQGIPNGKNQPTAAKEVEGWSAAWQHASLRQKLSWWHEVTSLSTTTATRGLEYLKTALSQDL